MAVTWNEIKSFAKKNLEIVVPVGGTLFIIILFGVLFPGTFFHYWWNGGPVIMLLIAALVVALTLKFASNKHMRGIIVSVIGFIIVAAMLRGFFGNPSAPVHESVAVMTPTSPMPSSSKSCPGVAPVAPVKLGKEWEHINPTGCALTFAVMKGSVVLKGPSGEETISSSDKTVGLRNNTINTEVRAAGDSALFLYMLCPKGKGPRDGGWECQPSSGGSRHIGVEAKLGLGVYAN